MSGFRNQAQQLLDARDSKTPKASLQISLRSLKEGLAQETKNLDHAARKQAISSDVEFFYYPAVQETTVAVSGLRWNSDPNRPEWRSKVHDVVLAMDHLFPRD